MNCFQKLLSSWWRTACKPLITWPLALWIAFKNYYLRDEGQPRKNISQCTIVVNCFQKLLSSWWRTARKEALAVDLVLWIAFKNYYLRDEGQLLRDSSMATLRCELLSKIIIFVMKDSFENPREFNSLVVNCFQKLLSSWWRTAVFKRKSNRNVLWIAFKNYYLRDEGQHNTCFVGYSCCCELLSKIIIFVMKDSLMRKLLNGKNVVNCFQKLLSSWWRTALGVAMRISTQLWIAFKNYYLRDEGQLQELLLVS